MGRGEAEKEARREKRAKEEREKRFHSEIGQPHESKVR